MKRLSCTTLILAMLLALSACGKKPEAPTAATAAQDTTAAATAAPDNAGAGSNGGADAGSSKEAKAPVIPGVLYALNLKDGEKPVVRGVTLYGNVAGSTEEESSVNDKPLSDSDIRFIFELNEWISVTPDTDKTSGLWVYIVPHREDPEDFTESFISALADETPKVGLEKPEEDGLSWGDLYVHPDYWSAGDYDLVFADGLKPVARVYLKLYSENELTVKSDSELEKMMADAKKAAE
ncbi:MAG: hypothetical protein K5876_00095 [Ruminiclostridium sp.]|nr:hypothetical protein [Ruminiclostridium sp.]